MAHQKLGMVRRKRNRGNGVTDIHQVGGMGLGTKRGPTFFKFQPICRPRHFKGLQGLGSCRGYR